MAKIVVVDDAKFVRSMLKDILSANGQEVVGEGGTGKEAVQLFERLRPDLLMMDIAMPEMNGVDALTAIMEIDPRAKVIMCSSFEQNRTVLATIQAGAKDFISKPFNHDRVADAINKALREEIAAAEEDFEEDTEEET